MNWTTVESSQISEIGYDNATNTLSVRFKAGKRSSASEYHYENVGLKMFGELINADSVGSYFENFIKSHPDVYPYRKVEGFTPEGEIKIEIDAPGSALAKIDTITVADMFKPGFMDSILDAIRTEVLAQAAKLDISTEPSRKALASIAYKVAKSKTFVDQQRKAYVATEKKRLQAIDAEGSRIWDILEGIQREVRAPLTEWEDAEKARVKGHDDAIIAIHATKTVYPSIESLIEAIAKLNAIDPKTFQEFEVPARGAKQAALEFLTEELIRQQEAEANASELERLRAESAARAQQDAIEAAAAAAREESERKAKEQEERDRQTQMRLEAELELAKRREAQAAIDAQIATEKAIAAERERVAAVELEAQKEAEKRAANKKHIAKIQAEAVQALMENTNLTSSAASSVLTAIAEGKIPNVTINY